MHRTEQAAAPLLPSSPRAGVALLRAAFALVGWLRSARAIPVALAAASLVVFSPALQNRFVEWDDYINLFENPHFRGLGWDQLRWMVTSTLMGHYIPVTWLTFGLDYTVWGMNPLGYHLTNILLHATNTALFYLVALRLLAKATSLTGTALRAGSAMATLFFALHPLRAESVAWATERRDVLSGLFFLLTVLTYVRATEAGGRRRPWLLAGSVALYTLGVLSKSIVMTLPFVLVLLDLYPLGRIQWGPRAWRPTFTRSVIMEKLPYFAVGLAGAATSYYAVAANHYLTPMGQYGWSARLAITGYSLWFYFAKTLLPIGLSPLHELPAAVFFLEPRFLLSSAAVVLVSGLVLALRRPWPGLLAAWVYYGLILGPVSGIVHAGHQLTHDRYSYLSCLGWALLFGATLGHLGRAVTARAVRPWLGQALAAAAAAWILALATLTWYQVQIWRDTETLWRYGVEADPRCSICQSNLGLALYRRNLFQLAREKYELALALRPDRLMWHNNLGLAFDGLGEFEQAMSHFRIALARYPKDPSIFNNMAFALLKRQRRAEAMPLLERAHRVDPDYVPSLINLGVVLIETAQPSKALPYLTRAFGLKPEEPLVHFDLARVYLALGRYEMADTEYRALAKLDASLARRLEPGLFSVW
jgi:tetratricopeptide (TPR) repeat protein